MPSSNSEARACVALLALVTLPMWACATAVDNAPGGSSPLEASEGDEYPSAGSGSASGGSSSSVAGSPSAAGNPSAAGTSAGKGGTGSGNTGSGGASNTGGKAGASSAGSTSAGGTSAGGTSAGGTSAGGATGSTTCDAAHAVATIQTSTEYTGKANDCVRLAVNPSWSVIGLKFQPSPGTAVYPVPFSFFSCGGNGTGSLTADYASVTFKSGPNPGCDFFVQFGGGATTIKVTYYD